MKISHGKLRSFLVAGGALLLAAGCASTSPTVAQNGRPVRSVTDTWATETPATDVRLRQDAYGTPRDSNRQTYVTGSLVKQDVNVNGNSADTAEPVRVYGQGDLRRHGGGVDTARSLSGIDPAITVGGR